MKLSSLFFSALNLAALASAYVVTPSVNTHLESRANNLQPTVSSTDIVLSPSGGGTYPRITHLADGSLLGGYTAFSGSTRILTIVRSTDNGNTWTAWGTVAQGTGDLDNIDLIQLANGHIVAAFRNHDLTGSTYTFYRITTSVSTDNGKTWSFLSQVIQRAPSGVNGLWEPFLRNAKSGALQVFFASENASNDQDILMSTSTDGGLTWTGPITAAGATTTGRDGMPACTDYTANGAAHVICTFETTEGTAPLFNVKSVVSTNDGTSWGERAQVFISAGKNAGSPFVTTTTAGTLVASFMTDEDNTASHAWPQGASMKIVTSLSTDPASWGQKTTVLPISSLWPSVFARTDGTVLACADNGGVRCRSVSFS
ncbi:glycoside hydrolase family 93 protein [Roridomyces roridus]|uniref:Glycoside hydrolase family 93 protein n=1 Tax=Roridomyces roridus TaxID=1738132 RepID=A0AAD7FH01_9AGAR|nr:glycoside hydrolase family 93 protein [Roridomyces roridus]